MSRDVCSVRIIYQVRQKPNNCWTGGCSLLPHVFLPGAEIPTRKLKITIIYNKFKIFWLLCGGEEAGAYYNVDRCPALGYRVHEQRVGIIVAAHSSTEVCIPVKFENFLKIINSVARTCSSSYN